MSRKTEPKAATKPKPPSRREELLEVATTLFIERGFSATSMNDISVRAGMRKASLYHHFPSKETLLIEAVTLGIESLVEALEALSADGEATAEHRLEHAVDLLYDSIVFSPIGRLSPLIAETSRLYPAIAQAFHDGYIAPIRCAFGAVIQRGIDDGAFEAIDVPAAVEIAAGPALALSLSRAMFASFEDVDERYDVARAKASHVTLMLRMLRSPPAME